MNENKNIVKIWFVGNNDTEHPDMVIENCEMKRYNGGMGITKNNEIKEKEMFVPYHNLNIISSERTIDEDST